MTGDKLTRVAVYWRSGASWADVVRRFKGSRENHSVSDLRLACHATGHRLDEIPSPRPKGPKARLALARQRWTDGWTYHRLMGAHKNDMTHTEARQMIRETGIRLNDMPKETRTRKQYRNEKWTDDETERLQQLREAGLTYPQCAAQLGRSENAIASRCQLLRWKAEDEALGLPRHQSATRKCLSCLKPFGSEHRHNRICEACKGHEKFGGVATIATARVKSNGSDRL